MDTYDYADLPPTPSRPRLGALDLLSIAVLLLTLCLGGYFLLIFINPQSPLNPLPPPTQIQPLSFPTPTLGLPPTWTPTYTLEPTATRTLAPTWTPMPTTPLATLPSPTPRVTVTRTAAGGATATFTPSPRPTGMPFTSTITPIASTIIHPEAGCNWLGVGGEASDLNNSPVLYLIVRLGGTLGGRTIDPTVNTTITGIAPAYGRAGFEFVLGDKPVASTGTLWIQLLDQAGLPLSEKVYFNTYDDCTRNLILIRFKKVR